MSSRLLLCLLLSSCTASPDGPPAVRVATWNVHDLLDPGLDRDRIGLAASVLDRLDADVVVLEEVDQGTVAALAGSGYVGMTLPGNDPRGIEVGLLSRLEVNDVVSHREDVFDGHRYARDCLEVHLSAGATPVAVLGVHFKSKAAPDDPEKRLAEARHTRSVADRMAEEAVLVAGDMNDVPGSPALEAFAGYSDVASELAAPFTNEYQGRRELIDHELASPWLAARLDPGSVTIDHGADVRRTSDHAPLAATFRLR